MKTGLSDSYSFEDWNISLGVRNKPHGPYLTYKHVRHFSLFKRFLFLGQDSFSGCTVDLELDCHSFLISSDDSFMIMMGCKIIPAGSFK